MRPEEIHGAKRIGHVPRRFGSSFRRERFRKYEEAIEGIGETQRSGSPERKPQIDIAKIPAHGRTDDEAEAERRADQAELFWPFFRRSDIGDVSETCGHVGSGNAGDDPADKQPAERRSESHKNVVDAQAKTGDEDDGAAPEAIRPGAQERRENKLHGVPRESEIAGDG